MISFKNIFRIESELSQAMHFIFPLELRDMAAIAILKK